MMTREARTMSRILAVLVILVMASGAAWASWAAAPVKDWTESGAGTGGNIYYGGGVYGGNFFTGQIDYGPMEWSTTQTGGTALVHSYDTAQDGAKSAATVGGYIFYTYDDGGVYRLNNDWTGATARVGDVSESITTDGTYLYTNDDTTRGTIHKYTIANDAGSFTLTENYAAASGATRVRGLSYYAGKLYAVDYSGTGIYEIDAATGASTQIGTHYSSGTGYQAVRYNNELLVVGLDDCVTVYDFVGGVLGAGTAYNLGLGDLYGVGIADGGAGFWVTSTGSQISYFTIPEPMTMVLLGLGSAALIRRRK